mmetsp:Transcript_23101/g.41710  ORF Transcript_23101/g.41710 Transcript_23101/m.41710 type:complete len:90 (-) Transcript_23101:199-468(-)
MDSGPMVEWEDPVCPNGSIWVPNFYKAPNQSYYYKTHETTPIPQAVCAVGVPDNKGHFIIWSRQGIPVGTIKWHNFLENEHKRLACHGD